jgi:hypothetical protein
MSKLRSRRRRNEKTKKTKKRERGAGKGEKSVVSPCGVFLKIFSCFPFPSKCCSTTVVAKMT